MPPLQYRLGYDPQLQRWLVLEESTDFDGFVCVMRLPSRGEALSAIQWLQESQRRLRAIQHHRAALRSAR